MVDRTAAKVALLVGGGVLAFLLLGAVLRFLVRIVTFAGGAVLAVVLAYVAYQVLKGWRGGGDGAEDGIEVGRDGVDAVDEPGAVTEPDAQVADGPAAGDAGLDGDDRDEIDRELDELLDDR
jgi:hypothetical protein